VVICIEQSVHNAYISADATVSMAYISGTSIQGCTGKEVLKRTLLMYAKAFLASHRNEPESQLVPARDN